MKALLSLARRASGRIAVGAVALVGIIPTLVHGQARPNLSGTWMMNAAKSRLEVPAPDSTIFLIQHSEPIVRIFRTHVRGEKRDTATIQLRTDSSQVDWAVGATKLLSRSWWDGPELVFWTGFADPQRVGGQVVRYSLSSDRNTFTAIERVDIPNAVHVNRWVFDRRR